MVIICSCNLSLNDFEYTFTIVFSVIDFCLMKQLINERKSNYSMLTLVRASKSNCNQRSGRVGRVADGRVYRLVTRTVFDVISLLTYFIMSSV